MSHVASPNTVALLFATSLVLSCSVGDVTESGPNSGSDASAELFDGGGVDAQAADPNCEPAGIPNGTGQHNPGNSCIESGCHDGAGEPPLWTLAGTLYLDKEGSMPVAGGTLVFTDANAQEIKLITSTNGNFYTNQAIVFPIQAKASRCPNSLSMNQPIDANMGSCNTAGCHAAGNRIYVPE